MSTFSIFLILITIVALLLIVVIMIQNPKGGGLDSSLGGSSNVGGVQNTNKFLDNSTWTLAILLLGLILLSGIGFSGGNNGASKLLDENAVAPAVEQPTTPAPAVETPVTPETTQSTEEPVQLPVN